jgi:allantoinase
LKKEAADLVIAGLRLTNGRIVDLIVRDGKIGGIVPNFLGDAAERVEGERALLLPGFIDAHVHLNEPGRTRWEGLASGTRALAAGGVTTFFDMPLNSSPPCLSAVDLERKRLLALRKSLIDFGLWGGLVPGNENEIQGMAKAGAVGIKAFLCPSGLPDFPATDLKTLRRGAKACARAGLVLGVHAEDPEECERAKKNLANGDETNWRGFVRSRPESAEVVAIQNCIAVAAETGCEFHIVHVSAPEGIRLIAQAAGRGVKITAETCPHYLLLDPSSMATLGGRAKCAPPLRSRSTRSALWQHLGAGRIQTVGSDHSPCLPRMKEDKDFSKVWGGISGAQHSMLVFIQAARRRGISWARIVELTSSEAARRFTLKKKAGLRLGADADFVLLKPAEGYSLRAEELATRYPMSPYLDTPMDWKIEATYVRGRPVFQKGQFSKPGRALEVERLGK